MLRRPACSPGRRRPSCDAGLDEVATELEQGTFEFLPDDEDIHMAIERAPHRDRRPCGGKVHTARSRNDQVATDMALFVRDRRPRRAAGCAT